MAGLRTFFRDLFWQSKQGGAGIGQLAHLTKSIERNPHQDAKYIELLQVCESIGDLEGAIVYLRKFVDRKRNVEAAYRYLLVAYNRRGDLASLSDGIRLRPNLVAAHDWFLTDAYMKRDWDAAIAVLSVLVELHPNDERWRRSLVTAYDNKGDVESAVAGLNRLLELCPSSAHLRQRLEYYRSSTSRARDEGSRDPDSITHASAATNPLFRMATSRDKGEFEKSLELKQKFAEIEANDRERRRVEHALRSQPRRLTPWDKFKTIKPTGSRDV